MKDKGTQQIAGLFAALADPTRLRLLNLMHRREVCVCYFVEILQQSQPKISRHLAYLRAAGVVKARREGKWMHYRIETLANSHADGVLRAALAAMRQDRTLQSDAALLDRACCAPSGPVKAPVPTAMRSRRSS